MRTVAIGFTISVLSTFGHEALGHGTACVLVRCVPIQVSSTYFLGDKAALSSGAIRAISLGGTIFNLVLGLVFLAALQIVGTRPEMGRVQTSVVPASPIAAVVYSMKRGRPLPSIIRISARSTTSAKPTVKSTLRWS